MIRESLSLLILFFISCFGLSPPALALQSNGLDAEVELSDGSQVTGTMISIDSDTAVFDVSGSEQTFATQSINQIRFSDQPDAANEDTRIMTLVDGSTLNCKALDSQEGKFRATTNNGTELTASSRLIDFIRFGTGDDQLKTSWRETVMEDRASDALVVVRDQKLQTIDGVIGNVSPKAVLFTVGERTAEVKSERLSGMLFYRRVATDFEPAICNLKLNDGSMIFVRSILLKGQSLSVNSVAGLSLSVNADAIASIDFGANRSVWLTDLDPATNDWVPLMASPTILGSLKTFSIARMDKSFSGKPLAILTADEDSESGSQHWKEFPRGFAIKGGGKISFLLAGQYRRLTGLIAFDPDANATGNVALIIQVDGKNRLEEILDASNMDKPFEVDIDLDGADRIVFQVDYHDRRSVGDILHAVDMKLDR